MWVAIPGPERLLLEENTPSYGHDLNLAYDIDHSRYQVFVRLSRAAGLVRVKLGKVIHYDSHIARRRYVRTLIDVLRSAAEFVASVVVSGDFPGSPYEFAYRFKLQGDKIAELAIDPIGSLTP